MLQGITHTRVNIRDFFIQLIIDKRHALGAFTEVADDYNQLIDLVRKHDTLIFATPIYTFLSCKIRMA